MCSPPHLLSALEHPLLRFEIFALPSRARSLTLRRRTESTKRARRDTHTTDFPCLRPRSCNRHPQPVAAFWAAELRTSERPGPPCHPRWASKCPSRVAELDWHLNPRPYQRAHPLVPPNPPAHPCKSSQCFHRARRTAHSLSHAARPGSIGGVSASRAAAIQNHHGPPAGASPSEIFPSFWQLDSISLTLPLWFLSTFQHLQTLEQFLFVAALFVQRRCLAK